jgi:hypothetical protein
VSDGDGWAIESAAVTFGWVVNALRGVANETFIVPGLEDGEYDVHLYRTWRGQYLDPIVARSGDGTLAVKIPGLGPQGGPARGPAQSIGDDLAFKIMKKGVAIKNPESSRNPGVQSPTY